MWLASTGQRSNSLDDGLTDGQWGARSGQWLLTESQDWVASHLDPRSVEGRNAVLAGIECLLRLGNAHPRKRHAQDRSPRKDVGEVCSSLSHRVYIWGPGLFTEPKRLRKWPLKGKGSSSSFTGDTTPFPSLFGPAQALARAEASCRGAHTSSCRTWERQGQRMWRGSDEEQLLSSHQADGRPKDRHPIHFILGTIRVHFVCSHIAQYSHESEQAKGKPQGLPVLSASLFFPAVGVHATIASWSGMSPSIHTPTPWYPWHITWSSCAGIFTSLVWKKQYLLSRWHLDKKCRSAMGKCSSKHSWEASLVDWATESLALRKELRSVQIKWAKSNLWWLSGFLKNGCRSAQFNKTAHSAWKYFFQRRSHKAKFEIGHRCKSSGGLSVT